MSVITIARQLGAGGAALARELAESLQWRLLDRALVEQIAAELRVSTEQVAAFDERVESFVERLGGYLSEGYPDLEVGPFHPPFRPPFAASAAAQTARRLVADVVRQGDSVVVGHGAQCVLQEEPGAFHVLVHAPLAMRAERVAERQGCEHEEALERIRTSDRDRTRYIREHFDQEWLDPTLYHICIDTGRLGLEGAAALLTSAAGQYFARPEVRRGPERRANAEHITYEHPDSGP